MFYMNSDTNVKFQHFESCTYSTHTPILGMHSTTLPLSNPGTVHFLISFRYSTLQLPVKNLTPSSATLYGDASAYNPKFLKFRLTLATIVNVCVVNNGIFLVVECYQCYY